MSGLPTSLHIAVWLVASIWIVAIVGHAFGAPFEIVCLTLGAGVVTGVVEWFAVERRGR
jgi:hypothetical protein